MPRPPSLRMEPVARPVPLPNLPRRQSFAWLHPQRSPREEPWHQSEWFRVSRSPSAASTTQRVLETARSKPQCPLRLLRGSFQHHESTRLTPSLRRFFAPFPARVPHHASPGQRFHPLAPSGTLNRCPPGPSLRGWQSFGSSILVIHLKSKVPALEAGRGKSVVRYKSN